MPWKATDLPDLSGRTIVITGANSGIGFEAARELSRAGAHVILACRDLGKAEGALATLQTDLGTVHAEAMELDLASLDSIRKFAEQFRGRGDSLHALVNNAGVMAIPRRTTADGFEMQLGTNHLGHFALTGLLLDSLLATPDSRVVNVSSGAHMAGKMNFDDLQSERRYGKWRAYGQSKLANLLFTFELDRRLRAAGAGTRSVACHPGYAATNLQFVGPQMEGSGFGKRMMGLANRLFSQSADMGALPTIYAAAAEGANGGDYIGPDGFTGQAGYPTRVGCSSRAKNVSNARQLWQASEDLTGVRYAALAG